MLGQRRVYLENICEQYKNYNICLNPINVCEICVTILCFDFCAKCIALPVIKSEKITADIKVMSTRCSGYYTAIQRQRAVTAHLKVSSYCTLSLKSSILIPPSLKLLKHICGRYSADKILGFVRRFFFK